MPFGLVVSGALTLPLMGLYFYCTEIRPLTKRAIKKITSFRTSKRISRSTRGLAYYFAASNGNLLLYPLGIFIYTTYGSGFAYGGLLTAFGLRVVRQVVEVLVAKSIMCVNQPQPWLSVVISNVYYLVYLSFVFQQSDSYIPILAFGLLNIAFSYLEYHNVMAMKKLDTSKPGMINQSVWLIWFEDIALTEFCEVIIPAIFGIYVAFVYYISPNRKYFMLFKEENFDYDDLVQTEISIAFYVMIEIISFYMKREYIHKSFHIDLLKLLHFSLSKCGIQLGMGIMCSFMVAILSELDHIRNDWTLEMVKKCFAL